TVVHRCAYLLRVERVRPQSVLVCCFNRSAALELRRRLAELAGDDARGVTVLTYHGLAMRLLGRSFTGEAGGRTREPDFDALITDAVKLLRGEVVPAGLESDELRDRLLGGYQHILVDEYQDIDAPQYELISALAGRALDDPDLKLSILAVGDDDLNIYTFRGANVEFIRRFQQEYDAEVHYLVDNYRSTRHLIAAANRLILANRDRMKTEHPIRIDRRREMLPPGGEFGQRDPVGGGRVQVIRVTDAVAQAGAVIAELRRLRELGVDDWSRLAVLSSTHRDLATVRAAAEREGIPIRWLAGRNALPALHQIREIHGFLQELARSRGSLVRASELKRQAAARFSGQPSNPWIELIDQLLDAWRVETDDAELPMPEALEFLYEAAAESRRDFGFGRGVTLSTVHSAKGTEYDHVLLIGPWPLRMERNRQEEARRAFYVGLTRARQTLTAFDRSEVRPSLPETLEGPEILRREFSGTAGSATAGRLNYATLGLDALHLSYPARFEASHPIHQALGNLQAGDRLMAALDESGGMIFLDRTRIAVARLSRKGSEAWADRWDAIREVRVLALIQRTAGQDPEVDRRQLCCVEQWEIPLVEILFEDAGAGADFRLV
ncbi:MAG: UvrD-helicase domain-containing protein, partial [Limisphaerales bacterium]